MKLATIDIGTNTTLLLVAEGARADDVRVLEDRAEITRLGRGIGVDGGLGREGIARTLAALEQYATAARQHGARILAVGTEALRRAPNATEFLGPAEALLGAPVQVIDGEREAALTFRAAMTSFPELSAQPVVVIDIGGGSTEVIVSREGQVRSRQSLPLGSVRLTERYVGHDPAAPEELEALADHVDRALAALPCDAAYQLVGTAGTVTTLAAMALRLADWDSSRVHGFRLTRAALQSELARLRASTQAEREHIPGLDPRRADVILAGACILEAFVRRLGVEAVRVNDRGIRWGLLYEALERTA